MKLILIIIIKEWVWAFSREISEKMEWLNLDYKYGLGIDCLEGTEVGPDWIRSTVQRWLGFQDY